MTEHKSIVQAHITRSTASHRIVVSIETGSGDFVMSYPKINLLTIKECEQIQNQLHLLYQILDERCEQLRNPAKSKGLYHDRRKSIREISVMQDVETEDPPY